MYDLLLDGFVYDGLDAGICALVTPAPIQMQGGGALRIDVAKPTENTWDIGASTPITKNFKAGDLIVFAVWAKLDAEDADTQLDIPAVIQVSNAPYTPIVQGKVTLTTSWQLVHMQGVSGSDHEAGTTNVALSIGGSAKKIDMGPAYVLNESAPPAAPAH
ncbi:hypothetical protein [Asticcacaulis benevestitus]|nr:hypothetical protein [Asticcacaulis benevestitus]